MMLRIGNDFTQSGVQMQTTSFCFFQHSFHYHHLPAYFGSSFQHIYLVQHHICIYQKQRISIQLWLYVVTLPTRCHTTVDIIPQVVLLVCVVGDYCDNSCKVTRTIFTTLPLRVCLQNVRVRGTSTRCCCCILRNNQERGISKTIELEKYF